MPAPIATRFRLTFTSTRFGLALIVHQDFVGLAWSSFLATRQRRLSQTLSGTADMRTWRQASGRLPSWTSALFTSSMRRSSSPPHQAPAGTAAETIERAAQGDRAAEGAAGTERSHVLAYRFCCVARSRQYVLKE